MTDANETIIGSTNAELQAQHRQLDASCKRSAWFPKDEEALSAVVCEIPSREDITEEDRAALWFSSNDYLAFKYDARTLSLDCERTGFGKNLDHVFQEKSKEVQLKLNKWVSEGAEQRGLERMANVEHGNHRQNEQFQALMDVLRAQDDMLIETRSIDHDEIRKIYAKSTKTARHFARKMAKADAIAAEVDPTATTHHHHHHSHAATKDKSQSSRSKDSKKGTQNKENSKNAKAENHQAHRPNRAEYLKQAYKETKQMYKDTKAGIIARIPRIA